MVVSVGWLLALEHFERAKSGPKSVDCWSVPKTGLGLSSLALKAFSPKIAPLERFCLRHGSKTKKNALRQPLWGGARRYFDLSEAGEC
jgi:hypothetical protein